MPIKILFSSNKMDFAYNTKYMFEFLKDNPRFEIKYVINNDAKRKDLTQIYGDKFISLKTSQGKKFLKDADVWFLDAGMPTKNIFYMRNKIIINFWHGIPLKKIGINGYIGLNWLRMFIQLKVFSFFVTAYLTTSKKLIDIMAQSFMLPKEKIKVLGQPRNDFLSKPVAKTQLSKIFKDVDPSAKYVLYAPTWRKSRYGNSFKETVKYFPFENFAPGAFNDFLKQNNIVFFVRPHSLEAIDLAQSSHVKILDNSIVPNINDILNVFDLMISDYSGIIVDFLILQKPILLLPYDLQEYIQKQGLNFDFKDINPGPEVSSLQNFQDELLKLLSDATYYQDKRKQLNDFFNEVRSDSMEKVMDFLNECLEARCKK
ncbi:MAG: CDP-glycerol glycerophosphotransferase family protein [Helicobacteraceae bacterium]